MEPLPLIRPLSEPDLPQVKAFTDRAIGTNYYSLPELHEIYLRSQIDQTMCSFVLVDNHNEIVGIRITFPPGHWHKGKGKGLSPHLWNAPIEKVAYFQSLFLAGEWQKHGWGKRLSLASIDALKTAGTKAVVCHAWCESPHDSSRKYLHGLGFSKVATYPLYWKDVDYVCTRCGKPCLCTAEEMIKYLE